MAGRPTKYSETTADAICDRIAEGESLVSICRDPKMPARSTVMKWRGEHDSFSDKYARAYEMGADKDFEEMEELAATATPDTVQMVKLQIDTRKWCLARRSPKKYGERQQLDHRSPDGSMTPTVIERHVIDPAKD